MEAWVPGEIELRKALSEIFKQKPPPSISKINPICHIAMAYVKFYKHVVHHIIKFARDCAPEFRLSLLYIIDAVCKGTKSKCGELYPERFGKDAEIFINIILGCPKRDWEAVIKILRLWAENRSLPSEALAKIDKACSHVIGQSIYPKSSNASGSVPVADTRPSNQISDPRRPASRPLPASPASDLVSFNYSDDDDDDEEAQIERLRRIGEEHKEKLKAQAVAPLNRPPPIYNRNSVDPINQYLESLSAGAPRSYYPPPRESQAPPTNIDPNLQQYLSNPGVLNQLTQLLQPGGGLRNSGDFGQGAPSYPHSSNVPPPGQYPGPPPGYQPGPPGGFPPQDYRPNGPPPSQYGHGPPPGRYAPPPHQTPPPVDRYGPPAGGDSYGGEPPFRGRPPPPLRRSDSAPREGEESQFKHPIHVYCTTLYIGKLGRGVSETSLRASFGPFGEIRTITSQGNKAFVQYVYRQDAEEAKRRMHQAIVEGREISIGWALNPRMAKDSLDRVNGEGDMPPHTLTMDVIEDMKSRGIIIRDYNLENSGPNAVGPPQGWDNPPGPSYYPSDQGPPQQYQGGPPPDNYSNTGKRSRQNWGDNSGPPNKSSRPY